MHNDNHVLARHFKDYTYIGTYNLRNAYGFWYG